MYEAHFYPTTVNMSRILHMVPTHGLVCIGDTLLLNAVGGLFTYLPMTAFIFHPALFVLRILYGYCLQLYIFGAYTLQITGTVFIGVAWGIGFGPLGLKHFSEAGRRRTRPFSSPV